MNTHICKECNKICLETINVNGYFYCYPCSDNFYKCEQCGELNESLVTTDCMGEMCDNCFENFTTGNTYDGRVHHIKAVDPDAWIYELDT